MSGSKKGAGQIGQIVSYIRVSTDKQGRSGLGIEAQHTAIARFAAAEGLTIAAEHIEVETGEGADALDRRPKLAAALAQARKANASVVVAKLDRLSRDVACQSAPNWDPPSACNGTRTSGCMRAVSRGS